VTKTIQKTIRKHPISRWLTGPEFDPRSSNRIIEGIVGTIRDYASSETKVEFSKTGSRITSAQVLSSDNSMTANIRYVHSYCPSNFQMMKDLVPAQIEVIINYKPNGKAYDRLAKKI
jgi:hypothetical protein